MGVEWTVTNLLVQIAAGLCGAHAAAAVAHEHSFGFLGHTIAGLVAGALSGFFLQVFAMTTVNGTEGTMPITPAEVVVIQVLTGAVVGAIAMFAVGFIWYEMARTWLPTNPYRHRRHN